MILFYEDGLQNHSTKGIKLMKNFRSINSDNVLFQMWKVSCDISLWTEMLSGNIVSWMVPCPNGLTEKIEFSSNSKESFHTYKNEKDIF